MKYTEHVDGIIARNNSIAMAGPRGEDREVPHPRCDGIIFFDCSKKIKYSMRYDLMFFSHRIYTLQDFYRIIFYEICFYESNVYV
jgi:hypothetical protein